MEEQDDELRAVKHAARALQLRDAERAGHDKRARNAEDELAAWAQARRDADNYMTAAEREKAERLKLYATLKARDALDVYYLFYPTSGRGASRHAPASMRGGSADRNGAA